VGGPKSGGIHSDSPYNKPLSLVESHVLAPASTRDSYVGPAAGDIGYRAPPSTRDSSVGAAAGDSVGLAAAQRSVGLISNLLAMAKREGDSLIESAPPAKRKSLAEALAGIHVHEMEAALARREHETRLARDKEMIDEAWRL
jgi:hypothetical protein